MLSEPMTDPAVIIRQTQKWLSTVVIGHGLCPFAKREFDADSIHYAVMNAHGIQEHLEDVLIHFAAMATEPKRETSLLIFPNVLSDFDDYLDMVDMANALLLQEGYEGVFQLASFHPDYQFAGAAPNDASHYTNRSPYPLLHILREASIEQALKNYPNPENIPKRNIKLTQALGSAEMRNLLADCFKK